MAYTGRVYSSFLEPAFCFLLQVLKENIEVGTKGMLRLQFKVGDAMYFPSLSSQLTPRCRRDRQAPRVF